LFDSDRDEVVGQGVADQGVTQDALARSLYDRVIADSGLDEAEVAAKVATGYGRNIVSFADKTITEITCHAVGVRRVAPEAMTVIEIGGQDSKVIRLDENGLVQDFMMNDRCAAGTGRFLEVVAARLEIGLDALGDLASRSSRPAAISSMCVVFAETEIIGLLASGNSPADIVAGVQNAIARRLAAMAGRKIAEPVAFTGGVAMLPGMARALEEVLERPVGVAPTPQFTGALGAAILASRA
jgi:predicted CoA-substrate-specific enzyme activase